MEFSLESDAGTLAEEKTPAAKFVIFRENSIDFVQNRSVLLSFRREFPVFSSKSSPKPAEASRRRLSGWAFDAAGVDRNEPPCDHSARKGSRL
jgi:hypothetical protein